MCRASLPRVSDDGGEAARRAQAQGRRVHGWLYHPRGGTVRRSEEDAQGGYERRELRVQDNLPPRGPGVERALPQRVAAPPVARADSAQLRGIYCFATFTNTVLVRTCI